MDFTDSQEGLLRDATGMGFREKSETDGLETERTKVPAQRVVNWVFMCSLRNIKKNKKKKKKTQATTATSGWKSRKEEVKRRGLMKKTSLVTRKPERGRRNKRGRICAAAMSS